MSKRCTNHTKYERFVKHFLQINRKDENISNLFLLFFFIYLYCYHCYYCYYYDIVIIIVIIISIIITLYWNINIYLLFIYLFIYLLFLLKYWNLDESMQPKGSHLDKWTISLPRNVARWQTCKHLHLLVTPQPQPGHECSYHLMVMNSFGDEL